MAGLFMVAREEAGALPTALQRGVEFVELRRCARHLPTMELGDGGVHGGAVRRRVMRRQRDTEALLIVVPQWAGNEGFDRREAEGEWRTLPRTRLTHGKDWKWWGDNREAINLRCWLACEWELFELLAAEVERLGDKSADLTWSHTTTAPLCSGQGQAFTCSGQCDIGKASLLAQRLFIYLCWPVWSTWVTWHHIIRAAKLCSERKARRSTFGWEPPLNKVCNKDHRELQTFRLVNREECNSIKIGIDIGGRRIIPRLTELLEVAHQERGSIKLQQSTAGAHHIEEATDVADPFVRFRRCLASEFGEKPGFTQPAVEHLTTRPLHALLHHSSEPL